MISRKKLAGIGVEIPAEVQDIISYLHNQPLSAQTRKVVMRLIAEYGTQYDLLNALLLNFYDDQVIFAFEDRCIHDNYMTVSLFAEKHFPALAKRSIKKLTSHALYSLFYHHQDKEAFDELILRGQYLDILLDRDLDAGQRYKVIRRACQVLSMISLMKLYKKHPEEAIKKEILNNIDESTPEYRVVYINDLFKEGK